MVVVNVPKFYASLKSLSLHHLYQTLIRFMRLSPMWAKGTRGRPHFFKRWWRMLMIRTPYEWIKPGWLPRFQVLERGVLVATRRSRPLRGPLHQIWRGQRGRPRNLGPNVCVFPHTCNVIWPVDLRIYGRVRVSMRRAHSLLH